MKEDGFILPLYPTIWDELQIIDEEHFWAVRNLVGGMYQLVNLVYKSSK